MRNDVTMRSIKLQLNCVLNCSPKERRERGRLRRHWKDLWSRKGVNAKPWNVDEKKMVLPSSYGIHGWFSGVFTPVHIGWFSYFSLLCFSKAALLLFFIGLTSYMLRFILSSRILLMWLLNHLNRFSCLF